MRARVGHLREALDEKYRDITIEEFKNLMVTQILGIDDIKEAKRYELTDADWEAIDELADKKYKIGIGIMGSHLNMNIIEVKDYHQVL